MEKRDVVIVGAGPAGLSATIFARLDGWDTLVLEGNWVGGQAAIAHTVGNYPGFPPGEGTVLIDNMEKQATAMPPAGVGAELRHERALRLDADNLIVATDVSQYRATAVVLATGSTMRRLGIPGEDRLLSNGLTYYARHHVDDFAGKRVLVVGGGNTTAKSALMAKATASEVTLVHRREALRAYPAMVKRLLKEGVEIVYSSELRELRGDDAVESVLLFNNKTGAKEERAIDWVIVCTGTEPDTELARESGIELSGNLVKVDERMMTAKPGVFACGEITGCDKHLITAASQGATAGMAVSEYVALQAVKRGEMFDGTRNGKYADEYLSMALC